MTGRWRAVAVLVAPLDSPAGRVADAVEHLAAHLPLSGQTTKCAVCPSELWPCAGFDEAAARLRAAGIPVGYWVPLDLHPFPLATHRDSHSASGHRARRGVTDG